MKKIFGLLIVLMLFSCMPALAIEGFNTWSPSRGTDGVIVARAAYLLGLMVTPDGTNACKVELYNNASAAAGDKVTFNIVAGTGDTGGFLDPDGAYYNQRYLCRCDLTRWYLCLYRKI